MKKDQEQLLSNLISIPSPSGYEGKLVAFIKQELSSVIAPENISIDFHNNLIVKIKGQTDKIVMVDTHSDTVGAIIYNITKEGYITLSGLGGHDLSLLRGRKVLIITEKQTKIIKGVIGTKHAHLIEEGEEKDEIPLKISDLTVDIGIRRKNKVMKYVSIGDPVVIKSDLANLTEDYWVAGGMDDKIGCYILIKTIQEVVKRFTGAEPLPTLYFAFSSQEEIGSKGAKELVRKYKPSLFVGIDVTFASDCYEIDEREIGKCELNKGVMITNGVNIHQPSLDLIQEIVKDKKIRVQYQATNGDEGFNADDIAGENEGIRILNLGIPCRNLHSPVEIVNMNDVGESIKLLVEFLSNPKLKEAIEK